MAKSLEREDEVRLHYQQGTSDKVYHVFLRQDPKGWIVKVEYGRRGSGLIKVIKDQKTGPTDWHTAKAAFDKVVAEKKAKGYQVTDVVPQEVWEAAAQRTKLLEGLRWVTTGQPAKADDA